jgi:hypothetical protein
MSRVTQAIQNFSAGEISPRMRGRIDLPVYFNGSERLENFICETQGPARFRTGSRFVETTYQNKKAILVPFVFNDEQSYILELTDLRGRIFTNEGIILDSLNTISAITNASPPVVTFFGAHGLATGDEIYISGAEGMTEINNAYYTVTVLSTTAVGLDGVNSTSWGVYTGGAGSNQAIHFTHPFLEAELFELRFAQREDTMYLTHRNRAPQKLQRVSNTDWTCGTFTRASDPFTGAGDYPAAVTFFEQRTWYGGTDDEPQTVWASKSSLFDDMGTGSGATDGLKFTLDTSQSNVARWLIANDELLVMGANGGNHKLSSGDTAISAASPPKVRPLDFLGSASIAPIIKDKRIVYCQQDKRKIRVIDFDYETDSYEPVDLTKIADHITIGDVKQMAYQDGRPDVVWLVKDNGELVGLTYDPREKIYGWHRHNTGKIEGDKYSSVAVMQQIDSVDQLWCVVDRTIDGEQKRYVEFFEDSPEYPSPIDYYTGDEVVDEESYALALYETQKRYFYLDSGLSYYGDTVLGTYFDISTKSGSSVTLTSGTSVFSAGSVGREIWEKNGNGRAEITAYINATTVTINIKSEFNNGTLISGPTYRFYDGEYYITASSISGLNHLEGRTIKIVTDGAVHPDRLVIDGSISLDYQSSVIHTGLSYEGLIKTNNLEAGGMNGAAHGKIKNVHKIDVRFLNTLGASFGESLYRMENILFRSTNSNTNRPPKLFSGIKEVKFSGRHEKEKHILIKQIQPLPCTVQFIGVNLTTGGE